LSFARKFGQGLYAAIAGAIGCARGAFWEGIAFKVTSEGVLSRSTQGDAENRFKGEQQMTNVSDRLNGELAEVEGQLESVKRGDRFLPNGKPTSESDLPSLEDRRNDLIRKITQAEEAGN
jgi:hypothetical protein